LLPAKSPDDVHGHGKGGASQLRRKLEAFDRRELLRESGTLAARMAEVGPR
jgi:hypothetical protein